MSDLPHGVSRYSSYGCRCVTCRTAWNEANTELRRVRKLRLQRDPSAAVHGRYTTYTNWGCRCDLCRAAQTIAAQRRKAVNS